MPQGGDQRSDRQKKLSPNSTGLGQAGEGEQSNETAKKNMGAGNTPFHFRQEKTAGDEDKGEENQGPTEELTAESVDFLKDDTLAGERNRD